jgi:hypothetical protein
MHPPPPPISMLKSKAVEGCIQRVVPKKRNGDFQYPLIGKTHMAGWGIFLEEKWAPDHPIRSLGPLFCNKVGVQLDRQLQAIKSIDYVQLVPQVSIRSSRYGLIRPRYPVSILIGSYRITYATYYWMQWYDSLTSFSIIASVLTCLGGQPTVGSF